MNFAPFIAMLALWCLGKLFLVETLRGLAIRMG